MVQYDESRMPNDKHFYDQRDDGGPEEMGGEFGGGAAA